MTDNDLLGEAIEYADMIGATTPERQRITMKGDRPRLMADALFIGGMYRTMTRAEMDAYEAGESEVRIR